MSSLRATRRLVLAAGAGGVAALSLLVAFIFSEIDTPAQFEPLVDACYGRPTQTGASFLNVSGIDGLVAINTVTGEVIPLGEFVAGGAAATGALETELVVCLGDPVPVLVESCAYEESGVSRTVERYAISQEVWLVETTTGEEVVRQQVVGDPPAPCRETEAFSGSEPIIRKTGRPVEADDIARMVEPYIVP